jgi:F-type H+-transporting ATPase subunit epsilon
VTIPKHLRLEFVTPERAITQDDVDEVELPGVNGFLGVLPGHAPLLAQLRTGQMWYRKGSEKHFAFIAGGFVEVVPDRVSILAPVAERAEDIDLARAEASKRRAEERLARPGTPMSPEDLERARLSLLRAITRLDLIRQIRGRG